MTSPQVCCGVAARDPRRALPYEAALRAAGLEPVRLPPGSDAGLSTVSGLVLTGGTDVNPALYSQRPAPESQPPDDERDQFESALLRDALARDVPVLAICRGLQLFNVVYGGTLVQHLRTAIPHSTKPQSPEPGRHPAVHEVTIAPGTLLESVTQARTMQVNSRHHQAVDRPATELLVSARSQDGIIEALEHPGRSFVLAVQWHPEDRVDVCEEDRRLFLAFADKCRARAQREAGIPTR